jgi:hypothetical protein
LVPRKRAANLTTQGRRAAFNPAFMPESTATRLLPFNPPVVPFRNQTVTQKLRDGEAAPAIAGAAPENSAFT